MIPIKVNKKDYFSPSQINSFIERRDQYVRNYVFGKKWNGNSSFGRGQAIEEGLQLAISGIDVSKACDAAWNYYLTYCKNENLSKEDAQKITEKEIRESTEEAARFYIDELGAGPHVKTQEKIKLEDKSLPRNIIGYTDFGFPSENKFAKHGPIRDLKTAAKTPSKLSPGYKLQGTIYRWATGRPVFFDTVVNLKKGSHVTSFQITDDDFLEYKKIIIAATRVMEDFWKLVPDEIDEDYYDAFNSIAFPNLHGFWNKEERDRAIEEYVT